MIALAVSGRTVIIASAIAIATGVAGSLVTDIGPWYRSLRKPAWQPPDWLFGPVWTVIYGLTTWSGVVAWSEARGSGRTAVLAAFLVNAVLNVLWSYLFFGKRRPDWAQAEVVLLWLSIVVLMLVVWPYSLTAMLLLLPYLAWVTFASVLNNAIVRLNHPFGAS